MYVYTHTHVMHIYIYIYIYIHLGETTSLCVFSYCVTYSFDGFHLKRKSPRRNLKQK